MTTFSIQNFGCRATDADAAALRGQLLEKGLTLLDDHSCADIVLLNTCTVTSASDAAAREVIRKVQRVNPSARIVVTGCYAQRAPEELAALPGVAFVVGNSHLQEIPDFLSQFSSATSPAGHSRSDFVSVSQIADQFSLAREPAKILTSDIFAANALPAADTRLSEPDRTRPILKIQDGCDHRCSYCVIPFVRGRSRSLPPASVIEAVRSFVSGGATEIVLSGINLGSYGRDFSPRVDLAELVLKILAETELERLRFSSIEPQDVTKDFVDLVASSERIAAHFHVPMQSGSDKILKAMHRWYRAEHYAERINLIRTALPQAGIGADIIVGFPDETEEDYVATARLVESLPFTYLHVFSFSTRPGTEAAGLRSPVPGPVIRERARALRAIGERKSAGFRASQTSRVERVLTLNRQGENWTEGLSGNYLKVRIAGAMPANQWCTVRITPRLEETVLPVTV